MTQSPNSRSKNDGFTLVELLVVIAIVAMLSGLTVFALGNLGTSNSVRGGVDIMSSLVQNARTEATSYGLGAALIIDNGNKPGTKLRRVAVARIEPVQPTTSNPNPDPVWRLTGNPTLLPDGVFFLPDDLPGKPAGARFSQGFATTMRDPIKPSTSSDSIPARFRLPGDTAAATGWTDCLVYEFDGTGRWIPEPGSSTPASANRLLTIILGSGIMDRQNATLRVPEARLVDRRGFILRRNGRAAMFDSPEQMDSPGSNL